MLSRLTVNSGRKLLLNTNISSQKVAKCKFSRLSFHMANVSPRNNYAFNVHKHSKVTGILSVRHQSTVDVRTKPVLNSTQTDSSASEIQKVTENTSDTVTETDFISEIPDIPVPPKEEIIETIVKLHPNGETTLQSIGLGGYSPIGLIQSALEWIHVYCDIPWWSTIAMGTVFVRILLFPLVATSQRNSAILNNNAPGMQKIQMKLTEARQCGNQYEAALYAQDLSKYMQDKNINPLKSFAIAFVQAPIFISFFIALRRMANAPVESLRDGGLWWFTDLTIPDPYYILPIITCVTMFVTIEFGGLAGGGMGSLGLARYIFRAMPIVVFPFIINFPAAILCYWVSTNFCSLLQVGLLRTKRMRTYFNIPALIKHEKEKLPLEPKGFMDGVHNSWTNIKISRKLSERMRADAIDFNEAGKGALKKTFKYDPTKKPPIAAQILSKKR